jgi:hypothetical protein
MMKVVATLALLTGSALAFSPSTNSRNVVTSLQAEKSASMPFMNKPPLVRNIIRFLVEVDLSSL